MYLKNVSLTDYSLDNKNSRPEEKATRLDPGCPRELVINIKEITVEMKISDIKKLKVGMMVEFKINENLSFTVPNKKTKEYDDIIEYVEGEGRGEISEIEEISLLNNYDEDELEEITLKLSNGYAEGL